MNKPTKGVSALPSQDVDVQGAHQASAHPPFNQKEVNTLSSLLGGGEFRPEDLWRQAGALMLWYQHNGILGGPVFGPARGSGGSLGAGTAAPIWETFLVTGHSVSAQPNSSQSSGPPPSPFCRDGLGLEGNPAFFGAVDPYGSMDGAAKPSGAESSNATRSPARASSGDISSGAGALDGLGALSSLLELDKPQALAQLRRLMAQRSSCPLAGTAQNLVFGEGDPDARVMLVGEAPGAEEDKQGKPFVGQSGQLLTAILASIQLRRANVYIANVVPYRPPFNRQPTSGEIGDWLPFLRCHIAVVQPDVLVCVGSVAYKALLRADDPIGRAQEKMWVYQGMRGEEIPAFVMFHPAYLLRSPGQKRTVWALMRRIRSFLKGEPGLE